MERLVSAEERLTRLCVAVAALANGSHRPQAMSPEINRAGNGMPGPVANGEAPVEGWWVAFRAGTDVSNAVFIGIEDVAASTSTLWELAGEAAAAAWIVDFAPCIHPGHEAQFRPGPGHLALVCPSTGHEVRRASV